MKEEEKMAGSMLVAVNLLVLVALIALGALTTFISISMLWGDLRHGLHFHHPKTKKNYLDLPTAEDA